MILAKRQRLNKHCFRSEDHPSDCGDDPLGEGLEVLIRRVSYQFAVI
jgi:hypothetical protein